MNEELDNASLQMNLAHAGTPIVFLRLETYNAFKDLADACRALREEVITPSGAIQDEGVSVDECRILEALAALDEVK